MVASFPGSTSDCPIKSSIYLDVLEVLADGFFALGAILIKLQSLKMGVGGIIVMGCVCVWIQITWIGMVVG